jgi:rfaE bifunctional protein kinase chain/domain
VISDYQKGCVSTELARHAISLSRQKRLPVLVDPKPQHPEICRHATLATPNLHEAEILLGRPLGTHQELLAGGRRLLAELGCANLLITRGAAGMTLFEADGSSYEVHSEPRPVYDVTGAGDTVLAVLAMALCSGATLPEAVELANRAGGRVVLKFGTAEITSAELLETLAGAKP